MSEADKTIIDGNSVEVNDDAEITPARMAEVAELVRQKLRAVHEDDAGLPDISIYRVRVAELTEQLMSTPEAVAISRLAYAHQIERIIRASNSLQTALLWLAEDLRVELPSEQVDLQSGNISHIRLKITHEGSYSTEQLMHIAVFARKRIAALLSKREAAALIENELRQEIEALNSQIAARDEKLRRMENIPAPPMVDASPIILSYADRRGRRNYLTRQGDVYSRTRNLQKALRFSDSREALQVLLDLLYNIHQHAFPNAYRLEIVALHAVSLSMATFDSELQSRLITAKESAVKYEAGQATSTTGQRRRRKARKNRNN